MRCAQDCRHPYYFGKGTCERDEEEERYCLCGEGYLNRNDYGEASCVPQALRTAVHSILIATSVVLILSALYNFLRERRLCGDQPLVMVDKLRRALQATSCMFGCIHLMLWSSAWKGMYQHYFLWLLGDAVIFPAAFFVVQIWLATLPYQLLRKTSHSLRLKVLAGNPVYLQAYAISQSAILVVLGLVWWDKGPHYIALQGRAIACVSSGIALIAAVIPITVAFSFLEVLSGSAQKMGASAHSRRGSGGGGSLCVDEGNTVVKQAMDGHGVSGHGTVGQQRDKYAILRRKIVLGTVIIFCTCSMVIAANMWVLISDVAWDAPLITICFPSVFGSNIFLAANMFALQRGSSTAGASGHRRGSSAAPAAHRRGSSAAPNPTTANHHHHCRGSSADPSTTHRRGVSSAASSMHHIEANVRPGSDEEDEGGGGGEGESYLSKGIKAFVSWSERLRVRSLASSVSSVRLASLRSTNGGGGGGVPLAPQAQAGMKSGSHATPKEDDIAPGSCAPTPPPTARREGGRRGFGNDDDGYDGDGADAAAPATCVAVSLTLTQVQGSPGTTACSDASVSAEENA